MVAEEISQGNEISLKKIRRVKDISLSKLAKEMNRVCGKGSRVGNWIKSLGYGWMD